MLSRNVRNWLYILRRRKMKMKTKVIGAALMFSVVSANAYEIYPTMPGISQRDYSQRGYIIEGNTIYPTMPGISQRDYSKRGYVIEGGSGYPTIPGAVISPPGRHSPPLYNPLTDPGSSLYIQKGGNQWWHPYIR